MAKPMIPDINTLIKMGINPKTGLPMKFGNAKCSSKADIKKLIRKADEQVFVNRYTWYNLPCNITSQELERMLYYKGQLCFFYLPENNEFYFMQYALDGQPDFYGRYQQIHPIPLSGNKAQTIYLEGKKLTCVYGVKLDEELELKDLTDSCVLLHDYTKQLGQEIIPTQLLMDPVIDLEAECMPFLRTSLLMGSGIKGVRVNDADQAEEVREGARSMEMAALNSEPYVPIVGSIEFQELTDGNLVKAQDYLMSMQAIDNFRIGLHGVDNGGLFEKKAYVNNAQSGLNSLGGDVGLVLQDGLSIRQNFCNVVNSIWGLGIWCEPSENIINADLDGDGVAYERNEGDNSGMESDSNE